jgi:hypothetical protein
VLIICHLVCDHSEWDMHRSDTINMDYVYRFRTFYRMPSDMLEYKFLVNSLLVYCSVTKKSLGTSTVIASLILLECP